MTRADLKEYIFHWHQRHPGIMNTVPLSESQILTQGNILFAIGWITILGEDLCKRMGGFEELYLKLSHITNIVVKPFPQNGALIRIGDKPRLGDLYNGGLLDTYQAVGQVLFPISVHDFHALAKAVVVEGFHDNNECAKWLGRFFLNGEEIYNETSSLALTVNALPLTISPFSVFSDSPTRYFKLTETTL